MQKVFIILIVLIVVVVAVFLFWPKTTNDQLPTKLPINKVNTNNMTEVDSKTETVRWLQLSGSTKVGEGATWSLLIESDGAVETIHQGNKGNGEIDKQVDSAKVDPAKIAVVFDQLAVVMKKYQSEVKSVVSDGGEPAGLELQDHILSNGPVNEIRQESIRVGGFLPTTVTVEDGHPAFIEIKNILKTANFLTFEYDLFKPKP